MAGKAVFCACVAIGLCAVTVVTDEDIPEFQYPCYVDICTFPRQFCNSERFERRCSPCTRAICREDKVPLACKYICGKYDKPHTTITTTKRPTVAPSPSSSKDSSNNDQYSSSFLLLAYSAVATTAIFVALFVGMVCVLTRRKHARQPAKLCRCIVQPSFKSALVVAGEEEQRTLADEVSTRLLADTEGRDQARQNREVDSPPSYTTDNLNEEEDAGNPVQATSSGLRGNHRQVCSSYTTNPSPDSDASQHHMPWSRGNSRTQGARPKLNNEAAAQAQTSNLTETHQPESAMNPNRLPSEQRLNNACGVGDHVGQAGEGEAPGSATGLPAGGASRDNSGPRQDDSDADETSLKS